MSLHLQNLAAAQAQPEVKINANSRALEAAIQPNVLAIVSVLPGSPSAGDRYILDVDAATHAGDIAYYSGGWFYITPDVGWLAWVADAASGEGARYQFAGGSPPMWLPFTAPSGVADAEHVSFDADDWPLGSPVPDNAQDAIADVADAIAGVSGAVFSGARVTNSGAQSLGSGIVAITFDTEAFDTDSYHSTGSNTSRMTVPATGYYQVGGNIYFNSGTAKFVGLNLRVNGSTYIAKVYPGVNAGTIVSVQEIHTLVHLTAGDYVELCADTGGSVSSDLQNGTPNFWIHRVG